MTLYQKVMALRVFSDCTDVRRKAAEIAAEGDATIGALLAECAQLRLQRAEGDADRAIDVAGPADEPDPADEGPAP